MTDHSELIKKLRDLHRDPRPASAEWLFENQVALYDAAAAIEALQKDLTALQKCYEIADATVDAVLKQLPKRGEIVRCGECKWYQPDLCANPWGVCFHEDWVENNIGHTVDEDGFCYRGEREVQE